MSLIKKLIYEFDKKLINRSMIIIKNNSKISKLREVTKHKEIRNNFQMQKKWYTTRKSWNRNQFVEIKIISCNSN